jgi:SAM-dependent methyltransferase
VPTAQKSVQDEYGRLAARYDERWATYVRRTTVITLDALQLLRAVGERAPGARAIGLDLSPPMLRIARDSDGRAAVVAGDAALLPWPTAAFDAAVSVSSFHFWPDPAAGLREAARVLKPDGRLVLTDWCDDFLACRLCDRWLRLTRSSYHRIYGSGECRTLVETAAFEVQSLSRYKVGWLWGMMTLVARRRRAAPTARA